jgi:APA family basic amino acid/polyamine antiporter
VVAIVVQGLAAVVIALTGRYDQILNYVTCNDYIFFGLSAIALIVFRYRDAQSGARQPFFRMPGHPVTTLIFFAAAWYIVGNTVLKSPVDTGVGIVILLSGLPVYAIFAARRRRRIA